MASSSKSPDTHALPKPCIKCKTIALVGYKCIICDTVIHKICAMQLNNVPVLSDDRINCCQGADSTSDEECPVYDADEDVTNSDKKIIKKIKMQSGSSLDVEYESGDSISPRKERILAICKYVDSQFAHITKNPNTLDPNPLNQQPEQNQADVMSVDGPSQQNITPNPSIRGSKRCRGSDISPHFNSDSWLERRHSSTTQESIIWAMANTSLSPALIGDYTRTYILPYTEDRNQNLKSISPKTLQHLIGGSYRELIGSFKVIDCRYPYEFEGGHINGAVNMYSREQVIRLLKNWQPPLLYIVKKEILIFYCDISGDRGPIQYRHLRKRDREMHIDSYPILEFPEIYILRGGYKSFFEQFPQMCTPMAYIQMLDLQYIEDFTHFRNMLMPRRRNLL